MNKDDLTKSYIGLMLDQKEKTDDSCEKAVQATKDTALTLSLSKSRVDNLLKKFNKD